MHRFSQPHKRSHAVGCSLSCRYFLIGIRLSRRGTMSLTWCSAARLSNTNLVCDNRRQGVRYPIIRAVHFQWRTADGNWNEGIGTIRNIGQDGCFVESESTPPVGSALTLTAVIPAEQNCGTTVRLTDLGYVRHVTLESNHTRGFGTSAVVRVQMPIFRA